MTLTPTERRALESEHERLTNEIARLEQQRCEVAIKLNADSRARHQRAKMRVVGP